MSFFKSVLCGRGLQSTGDISSIGRCMSVENKKQTTNGAPRFML